MHASPRSTRREFLKGRAAADALTGIAWNNVAAGALPPPVPDSYLLHIARRAMACQFEVFLNAGQYPHGTEAAVAALDLVDRLEDQLSVFRPHSEITRLNRHAADEPIVVEPRLFALLELALRISAETGGAYDVTAGPLSDAWGFTRRAGSIPTDEILAAARQCVGSQFVQLHPQSSAVGFAKRGVEINLGSIGKGYALDRCAELLAAEGIDHFLLHGGQSSVLARGSHAARSAEQGWSVGVRHPLDPERRLGQLRAGNRALATSGSGTQYFMHEGRRYGHLLDPRSGWPAEGVLSASVLAPTAAEADALSTAFYVMGPDRAREYCAAHGDIAAILFCPGAGEGTFEQHLFGLADEEWIETGDV